MAKKLNAADAFFLQIESENAPMHIGLLNRFKLPRGKGLEFVRDLVETARSTPVSQPPFNLKLAKTSLGKWNPAWETAEEIDIDYHLRHSALPQPGGERELAVLISRLHGIPLDKSRPLWEMHVIEGFADGTIALYSKMHHALIDGVAGARLLQKSMSESPKAPFVPFWGIPEVKRQKKDREQDNPMLTALQQSLEQVKSLPGVARSLRNLFKGARNKDLPGLVPPYAGPDCVLNMPIGPQRRVSTQIFDMKRIKKLAGAADATLNDIVMAICSGALRSYLLEINELPDKPLIAQVPVSVRAKDDPGEGNAISFIQANLGTNEPVALARLAAVKQSMSDGKTFLGRMSKTELANYSALVMAPFALGQVAGIGNRRRKPMFNVTISNVPGPKKSLYMGGAKLISSQPVSLIFQGQALNITIFTYAGKLNIVYTACRSSLPHVQHLVRHAETALEELEAALL